MAASAQTPSELYATLKAELQVLVLRKDALEAELANVVGALAAPGLGGLRGPLVDAEGYPRADVDVHSTRTLRNAHARNNTDHKALMGAIEVKMHAIYALPATARAPPAAATPAVTVAKSPAVSAGPADPPVRSASAMDVDDEAAFALVDEVMGGGPAEGSGLRVGDALLRFGEVSATTPEALSAVARAVGAAGGAEISIVVKRRGAGGTEEVFTLGLRPRRWEGRGLLGCHLSPLGVSALTQ
ncbi:hypothetical protein T492DRAFT_1036641 [Pavlovales sp. CCMP2436]|nr:hypothetical protein T492DRAFT_1036641 [Pavlovales sp. CCMP2436]